MGQLAGVAAMGMVAGIVASGVSVELADAAVISALIAAGGTCLPYDLHALMQRPFVLHHLTSSDPHKCISR